MAIRQCPNNPAITYDDSVQYFVNPCQEFTPPGFDTVAYRRWCIASFSASIK